MKIIELNRLRAGRLNVRQLLNPIFFAPVTHHPDHKRQRGMRLRARSLRQARELKVSGSTWLPELPATYAWEKWYAELGWTRTASMLGRKYGDD